MGGAEGGGRGGDPQRLERAPTRWPRSVLWAVWSSRVPGRLGRLIPFRYHSAMGWKEWCKLGGAIMFFLIAALRWIHYRQTRRQDSN